MSDYTYRKQALSIMNIHTSKFKVELGFSETNSYMTDSTFIIELFDSCLEVKQWILYP